MGWIGFGCYEKSWRDFMARTFAWIAPAHTILHRVSCSYERITDELKHYETTKTWDYGPLGWIGCIRCEKSRRDFAAPTLTLIAPVHPVLHRVSCSYETIPNAPKYYETHRNICIGSNGVDWLCSLRKIPTWLRVTNFCVNCTSSVCFASGFMQLRNDPKCTKILWNRPKH